MCKFIRIQGPLTLQVYNTTQSSRALGWDTNNYDVITPTERYYVQMCVNVLMLS